MLMSHYRCHIRMTASNRAHKTMIKSIMQHPLRDSLLHGQLLRIQNENKPKRRPSVCRTNFFSRFMDPANLESACVTPSSRSSSNLKRYIYISAYPIIIRKNPTHYVPVSPDPLAQLAAQVYSKSQQSSPWYGPVLLSSSTVCC